MSRQRRKHPMDDHMLRRRNALDSLGLTQAEAAKRLAAELGRESLDQSTVSRLIYGRTQDRDLRAAFARVVQQPYLFLWQD